MDIYYDGTIEELFTAFYYLYNNTDDLHFTTDKIQSSFFPLRNFPKESDKFHRIKNYLVDVGGFGYYQMFLYVLASYEERKEQSMFHLLKKTRSYKTQALDLQEDLIFHFKALQKNVSHELHSYTGLLRFSESKDGLLYAAIKPKNDIIAFLMAHFMDRLGPKKPFVIIDEGRQYGFISKEGKIYEENIKHIPKADFEEKIELYWRAFYQSIAIESRSNEKLRQSHMPKRYWKYLPELKEDYL